MNTKVMTLEDCVKMAEWGYHAVIEHGDVVKFIKEDQWQQKKILRTK